MNLTLVLIFLVYVTAICAVQLSWMYYNNLRKFRNHYEPQGLKFSNDWAALNDHKEFKKTLNENPHNFSLLK
jgi:hypothetical protein